MDGYSRGAGPLLAVLAVTSGSATTSTFPGHGGGPLCTDGVGSLCEAGCMAVACVRRAVQGAAQRRQPV
jgi:hypothetical protein